MYRPQLITAGDLETLKIQIRKELASISDSQTQPTEYVAFATLYAEPARKIEGMAVKADGATWNPGGGAGMYAYVGGAWAKLAAGGGSFSLSTVVQTTATLNVSATSGIYNALCDATSNAITVNLPTAVGNAAMITVKKTDSGANTVTVDGFSTQTIDGSATAVISEQYVSITLVSDGSNWSVI